VLLLFFLSLLVPSPLFAAQMFFDAEAREVAVGYEFQIDLFLNTEGENINALEGAVSFPREIMELAEIRDGNSIVNLWIERPGAGKNEGGGETKNVAFSGITPGGFSGERGLLFSVIFEAKKEGAVELALDDVRVLRNDGAGSLVETQTPSFEIKIVAQADARVSAPREKEDHERPEFFVPKIARDETLFNGRWFIAFVAQDKLSGMSRYEVRETRGRIQEVLKRWSVAESPHVLSDQELKSIIWVKAVDKAGNERIEKLPPQNPLEWYENYDNWAALFVIKLLLIALYAAARRVKKLVK
jgi:hypothetical protein